MTRALASIRLGVAGMPLSIFVAALALFMAIFMATPAVVAQSSPQVVMLNRAGEEITTLTDGALVRFSITVAQAAAEPINFSLHLDQRVNQLVTCRIPRGAYTCITIPVGTLGWYWDGGEVAPRHIIHVANSALARWLPIASTEVTVTPRPVVMVHGFGSDYTTWLAYLGPAGYLARAGIKGYAVGDGQVVGTMYTGSLFNPATRTNTIAGNAEVLAAYIANVKTLTGAEQVDLVVHSMGGLISRYYIDRIMGERDVAQLIMLGTPNGGSNCAVMLGSLGLYQPAGLELREDYIRNVFNTQIGEQHDIPFYNIAGTPIQQRLFSPCSKVPNDLVVSLESATAAPVVLTEVAVMHTELTVTEAVFADHVLPLLQKEPADFAEQGAQPTPAVTTDEEPVQYSQVYTGFVSTPEGNTHVINIDNDVAVASFGLYDPSRTLTITVRGASGNVIALSPDRNGLTIVDDPESLIYLGYGFENPNPGPWEVTVHTTERTPPLGTEYAIVAQYIGGATVDARLSNHLPGLEETVTVTAALRLGDEFVALERAQVTLIDPNGVAQALTVTPSGEGVVASFQPATVGIHGVDIVVRALLPDGTVAERSSFLALEVFTVAPSRR